MQFMAKLGVVVLIITSWLPEVSAQANQSEKTFEGVLRGEYPITYLGIDFSQTKFIGSEEDWPSTDFIKTYNPAWNNFILKDVRTLHLIAQTFRIKEKMVIYRNDITIVHNNNLTFDGDVIFPGRVLSELDEEDVKSILSTYDLSGISGVGLMLIVESFDANEEIGTIQFTLFDAETKEIVHRERLRGKAFGEEPRRYWAESIHDVLFYLRSIRYKEWKKEYLK